MEFWGIYVEARQTVVDVPRRDEALCADDALPGHVAVVEEVLGALGREVLEADADLPVVDPTNGRVRS